MAGDILIMDCVATNRIVLKVKLLAAQYRVRPCCSLDEAKHEIRASKPDLIMLDTCTDTQGVLGYFRALKEDEATALIPVIATGSFATPRDRVLALEAGADDVLAKPFDDHILHARLRSLLRARDARLELQLREGTRSALGFSETGSGFAAPARVVAVSPDGNAPPDLAALHSGLVNSMITQCTADQLASDRGDDTRADLFVLDHRSGPFDEKEFYRVLSNLRSRSGTRHAAILALVPAEAKQAAAMALDLGANDVAASGVLPEEIIHRCNVLVRFKRDADALRQTLESGLHAAITDPLTGLFNRRYALPHLSRLSEQSQDSGRPFAVMVLDLDHFKSINDRFGHTAGDQVLRQVATRLKDNLRSVDLLARIGGEEFLVAIPDSDVVHARTAAERLCKLIGNTPFFIGQDHKDLRVTMSVGVSLIDGKDDLGDFASLEDAMTAADHALYAAKSAGRNKVSLAAA